MMCKHRLYQLMISFGTCGAFTVAFAWPHLAEAATAINVAVTLLWVWE